MYCYYSLAGLNYKNGFVTCCPRQADHLSYEILPSVIINSLEFKKLRKSLISNTWPTGCDTCEEMENSGLKSMRQDFVLGKDNRFYNNKSTELQLSEYSESTILKNLNDDFSINYEGVRHVEMRFSNLCNFNCLHCSDVYSSKWQHIVDTKGKTEYDHRHDLTQLLGKDHRKNEHDNLKIDLNVDQVGMIIDDLCENFKNLERIDFSGGEPLYQKQFWVALEKIQKHPNLKRMHCCFHTNFNSDFDIDRLIELLNGFMGCSVIISIDSGSKIYEYFRRGGNWNNLMLNIDKLKRTKQRIQKKITCTTSAFQLLDIENIFHDFLDIDLQMEISIVQSPKYINPSILNYDLKNEIINDLKNTKHMIQNHKNVKRRNQALRSLFEIKNYFSTIKLGYRYYNSFLAYIKRMDNIHQISFNDYFSNYQYANEEILKK